MEKSSTKGNIDKLLYSTYQLALFFYENFQMRLAVLCKYLQRVDNVRTNLHIRVWNIRWYSNNRFFLQYFDVD